MQRSLSVLLFLIISLLFLPSCGDHESLDFETYTSSEGGFTVKMPPDTKKTEKVVLTPFGKQITYFVTWKPPNLTIDKFKLFQVSFTNCPGRFSSDSFVRDRVLDSCISMRIRDFTEEDLDFQPISFNGYQGRAFIFDLPENNTIAVVKQCIVNNKLYDLTVVLKKNYATNNEVHTFFNSFKVLIR